MEPPLLSTFNGGGGGAGGGPPPLPLPLPLAAVLGLPACICSIWLSTYQRRVGGGFTVSPCAGSSILIRRVGWRTCLIFSSKVV